MKLTVAVDGLIETRKRVHVFFNAYKRPIFTGIGRPTDFGHAYNTPNSAHFLFMALELLDGYEQSFSVT